MLAAINPRLRAMPVTLRATHIFANDNGNLRCRVSALNSQIDQNSNAIANELLAPRPFERDAGSYLVAEAFGARSMIFLQRFRS